jgi:hypothetical protein
LVLPLVLLVEWWCVPDDCWVVEPCEVDCAPVEPVEP